MSRDIVIPTTLAMAIHTMVLTSIAFKVWFMTVRVDIFPLSIAAVQLCPS